MKDKEIEFIEADTESMWEIKKLLGIRKYKCHYCKKHIKKGDKFSIFNKPTRLVCESIMCIAEHFEDEENKKEEQ